MATEVETLRSQLASLQKTVGSLQTENSTLKQRPVPVEELPIDEQPFYEVVNSPIYTADDQLFPPGVQFRDKFGTMIPNECTMPLNGAAQRVFNAWQASLPDGGQMPSVEHVLQAAMEMRPRDGEPEKDFNDWQAAILKRAISLRNGAPTRQRPVLEPFRGEDVPLMSNVRIQGRDPRRNPSAAALVREPIAAADKQQPPVGSRADLLGRYGASV